MVHYILSHIGDNPRWWISHGNTEWYKARVAIHNGSLLWTPWMTIQDPTWWISHGNTKWYQVRVPIHNGTLLGAPGWQSKMVDFSCQHWVVSSQGSNTQWFTTWSSMGNNPTWWISHGNTEWYQIRVAIHNGHYFELHGWQSKMVDFSWQHWVVSSHGSNTQWYTIWSSVGDNPRW